LCGAFLMMLRDGTITLVALPSIEAGLGFPPARTRENSDARQ